MIGEDDRRSEHLVTAINRGLWVELWPVPYAEVPERYRVIRDEWSTGSDGRPRRTILEWEEAR